MKSKNYVDNVYFYFASIYLLVCFVLSCYVIFLWASPAYVAFGIFCLLVTIFIYYFFFHRSYTFNRNHFLIKLGFIKKRIDYKDIKKCFVTENYRLSYATSKKRICVTLKNKKNIYISPERMDDALMKLINNTGGKK